MCASCNSLKNKEILLDGPPTKGPETSSFEGFALTLRKPSTLLRRSVSGLQTNDERCPVRMKLSVAEGLRTTEVGVLGHPYLIDCSRAVSDELAWFERDTKAGCVHDDVVVDSGRTFFQRQQSSWARMNPKKVTYVPPAPAAQFDPSAPTILVGIPIPPQSLL